MTLGRWLAFPLIAVGFAAFGLLLVLRAAGDTSASSAALDTVDWTLSELNNKPVSAVAETRGKPPTLRLTAEKKQASGFSGVNHFFGGYEKEGEKLEFGALAGTRMAGPPEAMELEREFPSMLANVTRFRINEGTLEMLQEKRVLARFHPAKTAEK